MRKAIATIATGQHAELWRRRLERGWRDYAARHGYEVVAFHEPLDASPRAAGRSIAWQKLLIAGDPRLAGCDVVVWVDADIFINAELAPCIAAATPDGAIGLCREMEVPDHPLLDRVRHLAQVARSYSYGFPYSVAEAYRRSGFADPPEALYNTGVMVCRPALHADLMRRVYETAEDCGGTLWGEMIPFNHALARAGLAVAELDPRFNVIWALFKVGRSMASDETQQAFPAFSGVVADLLYWLNAAWFLHFAGSRRDVELLRLFNRRGAALLLGRQAVPFFEAETARVRAAFGGGKEPEGAA